jgi:hypothetical protein
MLVNRLGGKLSKACLFRFFLVFCIAFLPPGYGAGCCGMWSDLLSNKVGQRISLWPSEGSRLEFTWPILGREL